VGESKSAILAQLDRAAGFGVIDGTLSRYERMRAAERTMADLGLYFPVVLKPDIGERGAGVAVIRSTDDLKSYLGRSSADLILQRYIGGEEFGIFYYRLPGEARGQISSITAKHFPEVAGDGRSSLRQLILRDDRAVSIASTYERLSKRSLDDVPAAGETVKLAEIGSHCRGAVFIDAGALKTEALELAVDKTARGHVGFYFGRFDVRTPSAAALQNGEFTVLELNGVGAEATHMYDPSVSLAEAYRVMRKHWRMAFEIGAENRQHGALPITVGELVRRTTKNDSGRETPGDAESALRPSR